MTSDDTRRAIESWRPPGAPPGLLPSAAMGRGGKREGAGRPRLAGEGQGSELVAAHLGYTLHLCATHDTGVNPGVWTLMGQAPIPATRTSWRRSARGLPRAR